MTIYLFSGSATQGAYIYFLLLEYIKSSWPLKDYISVHLPWIDPKFEKKSSQYGLKLQLRDCKTNVLTLPKGH